jgi:hypothetical protein
VANYWKHRDEWNAQWTGKANPRTVEPIKRLGAQPPVGPGQLESLVAAVLGEKFGADALWKAIRRETDAHG